MAANIKELDAHVKTCIVVFGCLMVLTVATVAASYIKGIPTAATITIALSIALTKGTLVACYFMHLISEKRIIFMSLALTVFFLLLLLILPFATGADPIKMMIQKNY